MAAKIQILTTTRLVEVEGMTRAEAAKLGTMIAGGKAFLIEGGTCPWCGNTDLEIVETNELYCKKCDVIAW